MPFQIALPALLLPLMGLAGRGGWWVLALGSLVFAGGGHWKGLCLHHLTHSDLLGLPVLAELALTRLLELSTEPGFIVLQ